MNRNCSIPCTMVMFTCKRMVCRVSISVSVLTNAAETKCSSYKYTFVPTDSSITKFRVSIVQSSYNSPYKHYEHYQMLQHAVIFTSLCSVASYLTRMRIIPLLALSRNAKALLTNIYLHHGGFTHSSLQGEKIDAVLVAAVIRECKTVMIYILQSAVRASSHALPPSAHVIINHHILIQHHKHRPPLSV